MQNSQVTRIRKCLVWILRTAIHVVKLTRERNLYSLKAERRVKFKGNREERSTLRPSTLKMTGHWLSLSLSLNIIRGSLYLKLSAEETIVCLWSQISFHSDAIAEP